MLYFITEKTTSFNLYNNEYTLYIRHLFSSRNVHHSHGVCNTISIAIALWTE